MIRVLRPAAPADLISARVFEDSFTRNLFPAVSIEPVDLSDWLNSILGRDELRPDGSGVHRAFAEATREYQFLCPNYRAIPLAPLLLYLRNRSRSRIRLLLIAHAPGAYALEFALLRPLLRSGDLIVAPTTSARDVIQFLCPELTAYTRCIPHPMRPLPYIRTARRRHIVSLTRMHSSKLLHRQIEAMAVLRHRGARTIGMQLAAPLHEPGGCDLSSYARSLTAKISRLGLRDCIELIGPVEGAGRKARLLSEARLLVNLSVTIEESFGKSIVEAVGCGVPVLATRWDGFPETAGSAGTFVAVEATPLGLDVSAERIADALEPLLESPPHSQACRHEAVRFHPRGVRRLYRQALEAALESSSDARGESLDSLASGYSAAPASGLLSVTGPLSRFSWKELFELHIRDVARSRECLAGVVHHDVPEAAELRSLLILGVRAPLGRFLAGIDPAGMDRAAGRLREPGVPSSTFLERIGDAAMSRATIASRLACLSLLVSRGCVRQLSAGLAAMREDGLQLWGTRFLEIEALRQQGDFQGALRLCIAQEQPEFWGELAAVRLRQLAALCRDGQMPGTALPWLRTWLDRFPDSPDSGMVWLDRSINALAAGLLDDARMSFDAARLLLSDSTGVQGVEEVLRRAEADGEPKSTMPTRTRAAAPRQTGEAPWLAIAARVGAILSVAPVGRSHSTFVLDTETGRLVAKRMTYERDPDRSMDVLARVRQALPGLCPRPLGAVAAGPGCWYALFEWVNGDGPPFAPGQADTIWRSTPGLLVSMRDCAVAPEWSLESIWLDRLHDHLRDHPPAAVLLASLRSTLPQGPRYLAHGDFSLQNFIRSAGGVVLLDWEEVGSAPSGFDAGWMLALTRLGYGPPTSPREMLDAFVTAGFPESNVTWFETLGLLRLLYRAQTLPIEDGTRQLVLKVVEKAVYERARCLERNKSDEINPQTEVPKRL